MISFASLFRPPLSCRQRWAPRLRWTNSPRAASSRYLTAGITDLMPRVFATRLAPVEHACGLALLALDLSAGLRARSRATCCKGSAPDGPFRYGPLCGGRRPPAAAAVTRPPAR
ncbi:hypothetical protein AD428_08665 [Achromobacter sp. DMS1]|nr:hypothetical protein AD428_08665 [Achromobacter sp. DMS1]